MEIIVSVIIPTRNRKASLQRTLEALSRQSIPLQIMEVLVVIDGGTDDTAEVLTHDVPPFSLHVLEQASQGSATARNCGAAQARGQLLLFLDDDIEPTSTLVEAHLAAHRKQPGCVGIGAYPPVVRYHTNFFQSQIQAWWEEKFATLAEPGHRFTYRDLLSGNLSLSADLFTQIGGFEGRIRDCGGEDYELGVRLIRANVGFVFVTDAIGYHYIHETTALGRGFQRARQEGRVDVWLGQRYPELRRQLSLTTIHTYRLRDRIILRLLLFQWPFVGSLLARYWPRVLETLERYALYHYWQILYRFAYGYWYWRGVADRIASWQALAQFIQSAQAAFPEDMPISELNLDQGLPSAIQQVDRERPVALRIYHGQQPVGMIPPEPGAEPLRGAHLRPILGKTLAVPYLEALALEKAISDSSTLNRYRLFQSIRSKTIWFGPTQINQMWYEQYSQWKQVDQNETWQELSERNAAFWRRMEYELAWSAKSTAASNWRLRLYENLYRWHEPLYHWYTGRGWTWPTKWRQRLKQMLVNQK